MEKNKSIITRIFILICIVIILISLSYIFVALTINEKNNIIEKDIDKTSVPLPTEIIQLEYLEYDQINNTAPAEIETRIDPTNDYQTHGTGPNSLYLGGEVTEYIPDKTIKISHHTGDLKKEFRFSCIIDQNTVFTLITLEPDGKSGLIKTSEYLDISEYDTSKVTFVEFSYGNDLLFDSQNNKCLKIEQLQ